MSTEKPKTVTLTEQQVEQLTDAITEVCGLLDSIECVASDAIQMCDPHEGSVVFGIKRLASLAGGYAETAGAIAGIGFSYKGNGMNGWLRVPRGDVRESH